MRTILLLAVFLAVAPAVPGQSVAPWMIDDAMRVARRFDPDMAAERAAASESCRVNGCNGRIIVEGKHNPELIMPWELMSRVPDAYHPDPVWVEHHRNLWAPRVGISPAAGFWDELYEAAKEYIDTAHQVQLLRMQLNAADEADHAAIVTQIRELERTMCWRRADALANARLRFGRCAFDRFLYEAVAPDLQVGSRSETAETTLRIERGCWEAAALTVSAASP
jgi:hypothetical protein